MVGIVLREVIVQNRSTAVGELLYVLIVAVGINGFREEAFSKPLVSNLQSGDVVVVKDSKLNVVIRLRPVCINKVRVAVGTIDSGNGVEAVIVLSREPREDALAVGGLNALVLSIQHELVQVFERLELRRTELLINVVVDHPARVTAGSALTSPVRDTIETAVNGQQLLGGFEDVLIKGAAFIPQGVDIDELAEADELLPVRVTVHDDNIRQVVGGDHQVQSGIRIGFRAGIVDRDVELFVHVLRCSVFAPGLNGTLIAVICIKFVVLGGVVRAGGTGYLGACVTAVCGFRCGRFRFGRCAAFSRGRVSAAAAAGYCQNHGCCHDCCQSLQERVSGLHTLPP